MSSLIALLSWRTRGSHCYSKYYKWSTAKFSMPRHTIEDHLSSCVLPIVSE